MRVVMTGLMRLIVRVVVAVVVTVIVVVMMVVLVSVSMIVIVRMRLGMLVRVDGYRLFADDAELRRANPSTNHRFSPDGIGRDREAAERAADVVERDAGVDQCTQHHVAGCAREAIEVQDPHNRIILPGYQVSSRGSCPASMNE